MLWGVGEARTLAYAPCDGTIEHVIEPLKLPRMNTYQLNQLSFVDVIDVW